MIEENEVHQYNLILINDIDFNKIVVSNKIPFRKQDFKYFIDYKDATKIKLLCIFYTRTTIYKKDFDKTKFMHFWIKDENFFDKYNKTLS